MNKKSKVIDVDSDLEELNEEKKNLESKTNKKMNDKENERMANSYQMIQNQFQDLNCPACIGRQCLLRSIIRKTPIYACNQNNHPGQYYCHDSFFKIEQQKCPVCREMNALFSIGQFHLAQLKQYLLDEYEVNDLMAMMHKYCSKLQNPKIKFKQIKENQLFHFTDYLLTPNDSGADAILKWFKQNPGEFNIIMVCMTVEVFNAIDVQRRQQYYANGSILLKTQGTVVIISF